MSKYAILVATLIVAMLPFSPTWADKFNDTAQIFQQSGQSSAFFNNSYGYALFPTIGKAGIGIGGAYGTGRVYRLGHHIGDISMTQVSVGFQLGAQGFSQIVFLQDERAFHEFTGSNFEFGADAGVVVVTAGAQAGVSTSGSSAGVSGGQHDASTVGQYYKGMAVFTVAKGGLMIDAKVSGQKFTYQPLP